MNESALSPAEWAAGKSWFPRAVIMAWIAWTAAQVIRDAEGFTTILGGVNFGIHEFGHIAFGAFPTFLAVLGGSLMQLLVPLGAGVALFITQRDWFALSFCGAWLAMALGDVAHYIADSRALQMDLVSLGEDDGSSDFTGHDWNYLLGKMGHLGDDLKIAAACRFVAGVILLLSVLHALRLFWLMARAPKPS